MLKVFAAFLSLLWLTSSSGLVRADENAGGTVIECATTMSPDEIAQQEAHFAANKVPRPTNADTNAPAAATVNVYWHAISRDSNTNITQATIKSSMDSLNTGFSQTGLSFKLVNVTYTTNGSWYNIDGYAGRPQTDMKRALRIGGPADLNIYTVGTISIGTGRVLGYTYHPSAYARQPIEDGVVCVDPSLPGSKATTLIHEVGHWVGLYHTFEHGCSFPGDYVSDTPYEGSPAGGCPTDRDTCPFQPGKDPVRNFMDYSSDACRTEFTKGQADRLQDQIRTYRGIKI